MLIDAASPAAMVERNRAALSCSVTALMAAAATTSTVYLAGPAGDGYLDAVVFDLTCAPLPPRPATPAEVIAATRTMNDAGAGDQLLLHGHHVRLDRSLRRRLASTPASRRARRASLGDHLRRSPPVARLRLVYKLSAPAKTVVIDAGACAPPRPPARLRRLPRARQRAPGLRRAGLVISATAPGGDDVQVGGVDCDWLRRRPRRRAGRRRPAVRARRPRRRQPAGGARPAR